MSEEIKWIANILVGWMMCLAWQEIKKIIEIKLKDKNT